MATEYTTHLKDSINLDNRYAISTLYNSILKTAKDERITLSARIHRATNRVITVAKDCSSVIIPVAAIDLKSNLFPCCFHNLMTTHAWNAKSAFAIDLAWRSTIESIVTPTNTESLIYANFINVDDVASSLHNSNLFAPDNPTFYVGNNPRSSSSVKIDKVLSDALGRKVKQRELMASNGGRYNTSVPPDGTSTRNLKTTLTSAYLLYSSEQHYRDKEYMGLGAYVSGNHYIDRSRVARPDLHSLDERYFRETLEAITLRIVFYVVVTNGDFSTTVGTAGIADKPISAGTVITLANDASIKIGITSGDQVIVPEQTVKIF